MITPMSNEQPAATALFQEWIDRLPELVSKTIEMLDRQQLEAAAKLINGARRIFCVGSGSSVATAWHIAISLSAHAGAASSYISTSQLVSMNSLGAGDLVVLVSQGFNRSDAAIVMHTARQSGAAIVVLTANQMPITAGAVIRFVPLADQERLFCRPCGGITSFIAGALLSAICLKQPISSEDLIHATAVSSLPEWRSRHTLPQISNLVHQASLVIVLGSGHLQPGLHHLALSLREGAGKVAEFYEIEYYAHGQYAPHFRHHDNGGRVVYLLAEAVEDRVSKRAVERILPLLESTKASYEIASLSGAVPVALLSLLAASNQIVREVILQNNYDMNHPRGKEENRGFQLVEATYYE